ncbi:hypothetical protein Fcan01_14362 [Folsomia candida]|uniref:Uncharacterized protein n=1 Tax=Folsomia candida TaxID=158441 RepID=A0A226E0D7_FOLCA|nr:hypothetical protein Fcan01_14362 [Folsomia candida]
MTAHSHQEFKDNPVAIQFKPPRLPIQNVTFPQLTIGKLNNINDQFVEEVGELQKQYDVATPEIIKYNDLELNRNQVKKTLILMKMFCQPWLRGSNWYPTESPPKQGDGLRLDFDLNNFPLMDFGKDNTFEKNLAPKIIEGTTKCTEMMLACTFNSIPVDCSEATNIITMLEEMQRNIGETENNAWKSWNAHKNLQINITRGGRNIRVPEYQEQEGQWVGFQLIIKYPERGAYCRQSDSNNYRLPEKF